MQGCHICSLFGNDNVKLQTPEFMARCCKKRCNKKYCIGCIREKFDLAFQEQSYRADTWICYSCQSLCTCLLCKGIGSEKKPMKKRNFPAGLKNQMSAEKPKQNVSKDYFSKEQLSEATPLMKNILERKNLQYRLIFQTVQDCPIETDKNLELKEKQATKIKRMVHETLKRYDEDDQQDIELID